MQVYLKSDRAADALAAAEQSMDIMQVLLLAKRLNQGPFRPERAPPGIPYLSYDFDLPTSCNHAANCWNAHKLCRCADPHGVVV